MSKFIESEERFLTAIFLVPDGTSGAVTGKKYRGIQNDLNKVTKFIETIQKKFPTAISVNFYGKEHRKFLSKLHLQ